MKSLKQSIGRSFKKGSTASMTKWEIYSKLEELIEEDKMEETQMVLLELSSADRASIVAFPGDRDWTVLHHCSQVTEDGNSGLHLLCKRGNESPIYAKLISVLCDKGAYLANCNAEFPIHTAVMGSNVHGLNVLVGLGHDVNVQTKTGDTPLHLAVHLKSVEMCEILLDAAATLSKSNSSGLTALDLAVQLGYDEIRNVLTNRAPKVGSAVIWGRPSSRLPRDEIQGVWECFRNEMFGDDDCCFWFDESAASLLVTLREKALLVDSVEGEFRRIESAEEIAEISAKFRQFEKASDLSESFLHLEERLEPSKQICIGVDNESLLYLFPTENAIAVTGFENWTFRQVVPGFPTFSFSWFGFEFVVHVGNCEKDLVVIRSGPMGNPSFLSNANDVCLVVQKSDNSATDVKLDFKVFFRSSVDGFSPLVPKTAIDIKQCLEYCFVNAINATTRAYHSTTNKAKRSKFFSLLVSDFILSNSSTNPKSPRRNNFFSSAENVLKSGRVVVAKRRRGTSLRSGVESEVWLALRRDGLALHRDSHAKDAFSSFPFSRIASFEQKNSAIVLTLTNGKIYDLNFNSEPIAKQWVFSFNSHRPAEEQKAVGDEVLICGQMVESGSKKSLFYELVGSELLCFKNRDKEHFLGRRELASITPSISKEGSLVLREGHEACVVLKNEKNNPTASEWMSAIQTMQRARKEKLEAEALRESNDISSIPLFFTEGIAALRRRALHIEGLFRLSADKDSVAETLSKWKNGEMLAKFDWEKTDCHLIACSLKKFIREMPIPLLTFDLYSEFLAVGRESIPAKRVNRLRELLIKLPAAFGKMLFDLMDLAYSLHQNRAKNLMSSKNLSVVFSPSILRDRNETTMSLIQDMDASSICVNTLIKHFGCCRIDLGTGKWSHAADYNDELESNEKPPLPRVSGSTNDLRGSGAEARTSGSAAPKFQKGTVSVRSAGSLSGLRLGSSPKAGRRTTPAAESDDLVLSPKSALSPKSDRQQSLHGVEMADSPVLELRSSNHGSDVSVDPPLVSPRESRSPLPPARAVPLPPVNVSPRTATPGSSSPRNGASSPRPPGSPRDRPLPPPPPPLSHSLPPPSADVESEGSKSPRSRVLPNMVLAPADPPSPRSPRNRHE